MIQSENLLPLIKRAETNGFQLRLWFQTHIASDWPGEEAAVATLAREGRESGLIFSHEFARAFWKSGQQMRFTVPAASYSRINGNGEVVTITRKSFTRRTLKPDVWQYHLRQMVVSDDPLAYLCRFLPQPTQVAIQGPIQIPLQGALKIPDGIALTEAG